MLASVELENFRCIEQARLEFDAAGTGIVGPNGSGKTSLLEAIYFLAHGRSFRTNVRSRLKGPHQPYFRVVASVTRPDGSRISCGAQVSESETRLRVGGADATSISDVAELLPVQVIDPSVHRVVEEGSSRRRRLLDWGVFHVEHDFLGPWRRYQRALKQRNAALRTRATFDMVETWTSEMGACASRIDQARRSYVERLAPEFSRLGHEILGTVVTLTYDRGWDESLSLEEALVRASERDHRVGTTTVGPHRADLSFRVGGKVARDRVSRGQQKLLAASLVLAQIAVRARHASEPTLLLLDDPAAELDVDSLGKLLAVVAQLPVQLIATSLTPQGLSGMRLGRMFHVEQGKFASML